MLGKLKRYAAGRLKQYRGRKELAETLRTADHDPTPDLSPARWSRSLSDPTAFYLDCVRYFHTQLPQPLREHRRYFQQEQRGFGEDAFHVLWWMLFNEFRPSRFLEIGVYRGQTLSLASLLQAQLPIAGTGTGISPFTSAGDLVSKYRRDVDYLDDTRQNFAHFGLPEPELIKAFSTDPEAVARIAASRWDCIYIDGNHDYEVALQDWQHSSAALETGGIFVLDDAALGTSYRAPAYASTGHPGPSRLAVEIDPVLFTEILRVGHNRVFRKNG
jgi:predicted O-methyltransferase YrrM